MDPTLRLITRLLATSALCWLACAVLVAVFVDFVYFGQLDPFRSTFSEFIFTEQGARLVGVSMLATAFGSLVLGGALISAGVPGGRRAAWLIAVWALGLGVAAVFPMEPVHEPLTPYGAVHRYAALTGFITLPLAGLLLAARFRGHPQWSPLCRPLRVVSMLGLAGVLAFLATFLPLDRPMWLLGERGYSGAAERLLLAAHVVLLLLLAWRVRRHTTQPEITPKREPGLVRVERC
ncbi:DUF998 domain-containing protein [Crossiella sp. SN42]|uniref:DUF998 domain-containing protein n=1 Tax=Crossiella sp. SN42 TaxID=2944808 RepID=UPI00207CEE81|nr:DUF998 domain-containing protein [Crossiella sp. SN42]MCO1580059.1 DUF998 domain-containing protein [Crossiella sp. SN42]